MSDSERKIVIESGGIWEAPDWKIHFNYHFDDFGHQCRHCVPISSGHRRWVEEKGPGQFLVPRVVIGVNEGGFNSVGICLDCILEAVKEIDNDPAKLPHDLPWSEV